MNGSTLIAAHGAQRVTRSELTQFVPPPSTPTWTADEQHGKGKTDGQMFQMF